MPRNSRYYSHLCACNCGGRIEVKPHHSWYGIPIYIHGHNKGHKGYKHTEEAKQKNRKAHIGKERGPRSEETKEKIRKTKQGKTATEETKEKQKLKALQRWQDPEYREKQLKAIFKGFKLQPNRPEKFINKLLQKLFPDQWKYVGDGKDKNSIIAGKCPDFINISGQKKIIEHFGEYHHGEKVTGISNEQHEQERIDLFAQYGYQTLIIWEHELEDVERLTKKLISFIEE